MLNISHSSVMSYTFIGSLITTVFQLYCWISQKKVPKISQHFAKLQ